MTATGTAFIVLGLAFVASGLMFLLPSNPTKPPPPHPDGRDRG